MTSRRSLPAFVLVACATVLDLRVAQAQPAGGNRDLRRISLEDLMRVEVTSVSKKEEKLSEAPSAIFVITQEDIRRSGVTTVAELLRGVPGLEVANIDANKWAVSSRGFTGRFSDKMLVLIDGRSVYTPLFSGVYWDVQDTMLADIDRIEVIRGPGAALWGANAVNGVVNIITKPARETRGTHMSAVSGSDAHAEGAVRFGSAVGADADMRVFVKYADREPFANGDGLASADGWDQVRGGGRFDWQQTPDDLLTIQAEAYSGREGQTLGPGALLPFFTTLTTNEVALGGGHVLGRWTRALSARSGVALQAYYDRTSRHEPTLGETRHTVDVDFQQHLGIGVRHDLVWGSSFRVTRDELVSGDMIGFAVPRRTDKLGSFFGHDEMTLVPGRLRLTGGLKVEHNDYTQWELQPNGRAVVMLSPRNTLWGSVSRAVRTPSRAESDITIRAAPVPGPGGIPVQTTLLGTPAFAAETLRAQELGYRTQPSAGTSIDIAAFHNVYDRLRTFEPGLPQLGMTPFGPAVVVPVLFGNGMEGTTDGVELSVRWDAGAKWRLDGSYTYVRVDLRHRPESRDTLGIVVEDSSPRHQARLHSAWTISSRLEVDAWAGAIGALPKSGIPRYTRVDARAGWHLMPAATIAIGGRNLLDSRHLEFASTLGEVPTEVRRSVYVSLGLQF